jgi:hypothetical protein
MTTYKGINGFAVQSVASDPSPLDEGQVWYNNATYAFKLASLSTVGTWASGNNLNTARSQLAGAGITQTAALAFGGSPDDSATTTATESYNGSSWTTVNSLTNASRLLSGAGSQSSALRIGGFPQTDVVESWNGTSWTSGTNFPSTISQAAAAGNSNTAVIVFGGENPSRTTNSFKYNGTSWTSGGSLAGAARSQGGGCGISTAALAFGGGIGNPGGENFTESYNGTSWTSVSAMNTGRSGLAGAGTNTLAVIFGGSQSGSATELWNGTSWTTSPNSMATARGNLGGAGTQTAALAFGGSIPPITAATEEWTGPGAPVTQTITTS